jgi:hypothetical protein
MSDNSQQVRWADNPDNACAANGVTSDGRSYHYSAAHNGYVYDEVSVEAAFRETASTNTQEENTVSTETTDTQTPETTSTRTFYRTDYAKTARLVQSFRHVKCDFHTPKTGEQMARVDGLAAGLAGIFETDAPEHFSAEKFMKSTQLPQAESHEASDPGEDETANEGNLLTAE